MAKPRYYDEGQKRYFEMAPKSVASRLRGLRGSRLRRTIRDLLLEASGHDPDSIPIGAAHPRYFPRGMDPPGSYEMLLVAADGLEELGYDAAAEEARGGGRRYGGAAMRAAEAYNILEAGPPSVRLAQDPDPLRPRS